MKKSLQIWLWIVLVVNTITLFGIIKLAIQAPILFINVGGGLLIIAGTVTLLFIKKRIGFFIICTGAVIAFIANMVEGANVVIALLSMIIMPLIVFLLMKSEWEQFE